MNSLISGAHNKKAIIRGIVAFVVTLSVGIAIGYLSRRSTVEIPFIPSVPEAAYVTDEGQEIISAQGGAQTGIPEQGLGPIDPQSTISIAQQKIAYDRLLRQYRNRSIHVDASCRAVPKTITVSAGARILLDNQSDSEKTITPEFDSEGFILAPHHYVITNVPSKGAFSVSCDNQKNIATIIVKQ